MSVAADARRLQARRCVWRVQPQNGFTTIEVLVAMLVLVVGLLGYFDTLTASGSSITAAERAAEMTQIGDQTLQSIEALPYASAADSSTPTQTTTTDETNPTYYLVTGPVAGSSCTTAAICYQWDPTNTSSAEPVALDATNGKVSPGPTVAVVPSPNAAGCTTTATANCQATFAVYAFVTDATDPVCAQTGVTCASSTSYKRITVAVKNMGPGAPFSPLYFSTFVGNNVGGSNNPLTATGPTGPTTNCLDGSTTVPCTH
jgi:prepilin-type N-terminal cleavage/methylation domain-containing protein